MSTLYLRHPARLAGNAAGCAFALVGTGGALMQQGTQSLDTLGDLVSTAKRVVLILAACDVTVLRLAVPPLSGARLKAALPNLVEDHVLGDPAECVLAAGPAEADGQRTLAVADKAWLQGRVSALLGQGARAVRVLPAQLCLPAGTACVQDGEFSVRPEAGPGFGLAVDGDAAAALASLQAFGTAGLHTLYLPAAQRDSLRELAAPALQLAAEQWDLWLQGAEACPLDLASGLGAGAQARTDWQRYRWPAVLLGAALLVHIIGLNIEWLRLKREAEAVRQSMFQTFKAAYPKAPDPLYPAEQLRRNVLSARAAGGELAPADFHWQLAAVGEAFQALSAKPALLGLEFRDNVLTVKVRSDSLAPGMLEQIRAALATRGLILSDMQPGIWQVRVKEGK